MIIVQSYDGMLVDSLHKMFDFLTFRYCFQIDVALEDDNRVIEKSRVSWEESKRLDKDFEADSSVGVHGITADHDSSEKESNGANRERKNGSRRFDPECYDDRPFYSMLLKVTWRISESDMNIFICDISESMECLNLSCSA